MQAVEIVKVFSDLGANMKLISTRLVIGIYIFTLEISSPLAINVDLGKKISFLHKTNLNKHSNKEFDVIIHHPNTKQTFTTIIIILYTPDQPG